MARYVPDDITALFLELAKDDDRAVAIVGVAFMEHTLEQAIKSRLRPINGSTPKGKEELDRLYGAQGIFAGLSSKILGAYSMLIIGPQSRRDLELMNKIRNRFAHDMNPVSFETDQIRDQCNELQIISDIHPALVKTPRDRFVRSVRAYTMAFWFIDLASREERPPVGEELLKRLSS